MTYILLPKGEYLTRMTTRPTDFQFFALKQALIHVVADLLDAPLGTSDSLVYIDGMLYVDAVHPFDRNVDARIGLFTIDGGLYAQVATDERSLEYFKVHI